MLTQTKQQNAAKILVVTLAGLDLVRSQREAILQYPASTQSASLERLDRLAQAMEEVRRECENVIMAVPA